MCILSIRVHIRLQKMWPSFTGHSLLVPDTIPDSPDRLGSHLPARNDGTIVNETSRSAGGREREPESRGGAAVPPDGAEADVARPNRADAAGEDRTDSSIHRVALPPPVRPNPEGGARLHRRWRRRRSPEKKTASGGADSRFTGLRPRFRTAVRRMLTSSSD